MSTRNNELLEYIIGLLEPIDRLINDIVRVIPEEENKLESELAGLILIKICAIYEKCVQEILSYQAGKYHRNFGIYIKNSYERLNSKISYSDICKYISIFGEEPEINFNVKLKDICFRESIGVEQITKELLRLESDTRVKNKDNTLGKWISEHVLNYDNFLNLRHSFAHKGNCSETIINVTEYFKKTKLIIFSLAEALSIEYSI